MFLAGFLAVSELFLRVTLASILHIHENNFIKHKKTLDNVLQNADNVHAFNVKPVLHKTEGWRFSLEPCL